MLYLLFSLETCDMFLITARLKSPTYLGHILSHNEQTAVFLYNDPEHLHQIIMPQLPGGEAHRLVISGVFSSEIKQKWKCAYVMTEASAMKACAVASFLMHFTATLVPL